jgi:hypothetical protein
MLAGAPSRAPSLHWRTVSTCTKSLVWLGLINSLPWSIDKLVWSIFELWPLLTCGFLWIRYVLCHSRRRVLLQQFLGGDVRSWEMGSFVGGCGDEKPAQKAWDEDDETRIGRHSAQSSHHRHLALDPSRGRHVCTGGLVDYCLSWLKLEGLRIEKNWG